jgi:uncharacterized phage-associated protein
MTSVFDVAKYILDKSGSMPAMKLQKLCYYAQAWALVWDEKPLFKEEIEAWVNGPVVPHLYQAHKGLYEVKANTFSEGDKRLLSENECDTIDKVVCFYGQYNAQQLSSLTHQETPWQDARRGLHASERGSHVISHASMAEYYQGVVG